MNYLIFAGAHVTNLIKMPFKLLPVTPWIILSAGVISKFRQMS